jgi:hypothetical protein
VAGPPATLKLGPLFSAAFWYVTRVMCQIITDIPEQPAAWVLSNI